MIGEGCIDGGLLYIYLLLLFCKDTHLEANAKIEVSEMVAVDKNGYFCVMERVNDSEMITVIVPAYNAAQWLDECLQSVLKQSHAAWRLVVVDDGSSDATARIASEYVVKDSRCRLICNTHGGVSAARNTALDIADTEWVLLLDADDVLHPVALEMMLRSAQESGSDMVISNQFYGDVPAMMPMISNDGKYKTVSTESALLMMLQRHGIEASMSGRLYRRSLFECDGKLRFRDCRYEDLDLGYQVMERCSKVCLLPYTLYYYRRHEGSFINTFSPQRFDVLDVTDRMYRHFEGTHLEHAAADRRFGAHCNILLVMYSLGVKDSPHEQRCVNAIRFHRLSTLTDRDARIRNRIVAALSFFGVRCMFKLIAKIKPQK